MDIIKSAFSPSEGKWLRHWPESISKHDVVYLTPPDDPAHGMPIGNGDLGALIWTESGKLFMTVNKTDTWDDNSQGDYADRTCEQTPSLSQCCKVELDFGMPVFDIKYQNEFTGRISLSDATVKIKSGTPFSEVSVSAFASWDSKCIIIECEAEFTEDNKVKASIEKWGSRTFSYWYNRLKRDASIGLGGTKVEFSEKSEDTVIVNQKLNTIEYTAAARLISDSRHDNSVVNGNRAEFAFKKEKKIAFTLLIDTVTSDNDANHSGKAVSILDAACLAGVSSIKREHAAAWKDFWNKSFVDTQEDYLDNIWHLIMYYGNSSCKGEYPPFFCAGLFGWNADFMPWTHYLHWNMRLHIKPFYAANRMELAVPYFKQMMRQYKHALQFAKDVSNARGAQFTDVYDYSGKCDLPSQNNIIVGACIALEFWRHYRYTGDESFLNEMAWPVMRDVSRFYESRLVKENDGKYHIHRTQGYEGTPLFDDTAVMLALTRGLLEAALKAAAKADYHGEDIDKWKDILDNLVDFTLLDFEDFEYEMKDGVKYLAEGVGKGRPIEFDKVISVGKFYKTEIIAREFPEYKERVDVELPESSGFVKDAHVRSLYARTGPAPYYGLWDSEMGLAYPAEIIGLADRDTDLFKAVRNMVLMHPEQHFKYENGKDKVLEDTCGGWCHFPIVMARTGLNDLCLKELREFVSTWQQVYVQGFGHYVPHHITQDNRQRWFEQKIGIFRTRESVPHPGWPYRHFDYEPMPIAATTHSEMMLQSYDGALRLFAAVPDGFTGRFRLSAADGFIVDSEMTAGKIEWCSVESLHGNICKVVNPWPETKSVFVSEVGGRETKVMAYRFKCDDIVEFETERGKRYLITSRTGSLAGWISEPVTDMENNNYKTLGFSQLGIPRMF